MALQGLARGQGRGLGSRLVRTSWQTAVPMRLQYGSSAFAQTPPSFQPVDMRVQD